MEYRLQASLVAAALELPEIEAVWESTLAGFDGPEEQRAFLQRYITGLRNEFVQMCRDIEDPIEVGFAACLFLASVKSHWMLLNTHMNYVCAKTGMPDMVLVFRASLLASLIGGLERVMAARAVEDVWRTLNRFSAGGMGEPSITVPTVRFDGLLSQLAAAETSRVQLEALLRRSADGHVDADVAQRLGGLSRALQGLQEHASRLRAAPLNDLSARLQRITEQHCAAAGVEITLHCEGFERQADQVLAGPLGEVLAETVRAIIELAIGKPEEREAAGLERRPNVYARVRVDGLNMTAEIDGDWRTQPLPSLRPALDEIAALAARGQPPADAGTTTDLARQVVIESLAAVRGPLVERGGRVVIADDVLAEPWRIVLPQATPVLRVLLISSGGHRYAWPGESAESIAEPSQWRPATRQQSRLAEVRGALVPHVRLDEALGRSLEGEPLRRQGPLLVGAVAGQRIGFEIDAVERHTRAAILPVALPFGDEHVAPILGAAVLDDGPPTLLLDPGVLLRRAAEATRAAIDGLAVELAGSVPDGEARN